MAVFLVSLPKIFGSLPELFGSLPKLLGSLLKLLDSRPELFGILRKLLGSLPKSRIYVKTHRFFRIQIPEIQNAEIQISDS